MNIDDSTVLITWLIFFFLSACVAWFVAPYLSLPHRWVNKTSPMKRRTKQTIELTVRKIWGCNPNGIPYVEVTITEFRVIDILFFKLRIRIKSEKIFDIEVPGFYEGLIKKHIK
jgi:hypothetical protein